MRQRRRFRVSDGSDDVTGLEMHRRQTSTSYLCRYGAERKNYSTPDSPVLTDT